MFDAVTTQLRARAITVRTGTVDATIIISASKGHGAASRAMAQVHFTATA
ncbi:hypothetical protein [Roseomonas sp. HF4]|nr:hypothetical protein [Roseomonas sp. HF4]